ncbi:hypothetical protein [Nonomuraea cavernae]|uniref:hypothetical protein n=1 Tax=Nonomuraea cavernae TaxID=2045107 RepID=UPI0033D88F79
MNPPDMTYFAKPYATRDAVRRAAAHHAWLAQHAQPLRQPPIVTVHERRIDFAFVQGRHATVSDLPALASILGRAHTTAWQNDLHRAQLTTPHPLPAGSVLADFVSPRQVALHRHLQAGLITPYQLVAAQRLLQADPLAPAAFYKDTNPRNVLITAEGPVMVNVDDLTLAPFGYDLAKLVVTLAMTHGPILPGHIATALTCYNKALLDAGLTPVTAAGFLGYTDLHHILTLPYLGTGGYRHSWPGLRPSLDGLAATTPPASPSR